MTCPTCNHVNPKGTLFCQKCNSFMADAAGDGDTAEPAASSAAVKTAPGPNSPVNTQPVSAPAPLSAPPIPATSTLSTAPAASTVPATVDSPFGDFLPDWMNPAAPTPVSTRQARHSAPHPVASVSIDDLLEETTRPKPGAGPLAGAATAHSANAAPSPQTHPVVTINHPVSAPPADPTDGLPVPGFQMPPLWFRPPTDNHWQELKNTDSPRAVPSNSISAGYNPALVGPETREPGQATTEPSEPEYGVDRGFYYFNDRHGNLIVHALAGFGRRLAGAIVDSIVSAILGVVFLYLVVTLFLKLDNRDYVQSLVGMALAVIILPTLFGFLYHAVLVGLTGQTLGHRLLGIKVIRRGGRAVGLVSGVVRALYGLVPAIVATVVNLLWPSAASSRNSYGLGSIVSLVIVVLTALGMAFALLDKNRQGLHDKLADTYVVSAKES